jgi:Family of unknown function (DUF6152)
MGWVYVIGQPEKIVALLSSPSSAEKIRRRYVKRRVLVAFCLAAGLLAIAGRLSAHHGTSGYDMDKVITVTGTVTSFDWSNPHCMVHIDVKDSTGQVKDWIIELAAPTLMRRKGWTKESLKPGDAIIAETHPARNGATTGLSGASTTMLKFVVNGHELPTH